MVNGDGQTPKFADVAEMRRQYTSEFYSRVSQAMLLGSLFDFDWKAERKMHTKRAMIHSVNQILLPRDLRLAIRNEFLR